ncbi:hypothetical protein B0G77_3936 [Paraburkholderia sp. BL10I2N1]|nr:hypothetical protein B0G77_3936 [Paraburkholderia sp. BL10I2N1]
MGDRGPRPDGWEQIAPDVWLYTASGTSRAMVWKGPWATVWNVTPSDPPLMEPDLETACALAVALYRLGG